MPTVLRKNGFEFYFYSNDHSPAHIHVSKQRGEAKFNLEPSVELVYSNNMKVSEVNRAFDLVKEYRILLTKAFREYERRK